MITYDKVIRIEIPTINFQNEISDVVTEWWVDYEELEELPQILNYLQTFFKEATKALENKDIDCIALCCNL